MEAGNYTVTDTTELVRRSFIRPAARFALHYGVMVGVMFAGMGVFAGLLALGGVAFGYGLTEIKADAPAVFLAGMGASMTAPMVWWMARRGHSWSANGAMAISMTVPTIAVLGMLATSSSADPHGLLMIQHTVMLPAMLIAMLLYRSEYTHGH